MKLFRFRLNETVKCGVETQTGNKFDASGLFNHYDSLFFEQNGLKTLQNALETGDSKLIEMSDSVVLDFDAPIAAPSKIVCIGLNYADHARETGATPPTEPVVFLKASTAFAAPFDDVMIPKNSVKTDWEVELAVVISQKARYVSEAEAIDFIAGYCVHNDISEREFQLERGGTWDKGKGCDTFAPMGPYLVTPDEVADVNNLRLWLKVNDDMVQNGNTKELIFKIPHLVSYVSQFMTLLPGDVISTGTPPGVGLGFKPPRYLKAGDVMELGIEGMGSCVNLYRMAKVNTSNS
ncbi:MAG: fumarylacetoacetate hydrolase family protein [Saprospiraceae bacterium]|nr:fumarylacetoacetate hydrolase family protein [Saprospiraceae bacterium]